MGAQCFIHPGQRKGTPSRNNGRGSWRAAPRRRALRHGGGLRPKCERSEIGREKRQQRPGTALLKRQGPALMQETPDDAGTPPGAWERPTCT